MEQHHAIIVSGFNRGNLQAARERALQLFDRLPAEVTNLNGRGLRGVVSFMIAPDGIPADYDLAARARKARESFVAWLETHTGMVDYVAIDFAATKMPSREHRTAPSAVPYNEMSLGQRQSVDALCRIIDDLFEPEPAADPSLLDDKLSYALDFDDPLVDWHEFLGEIEARLPVTIPKLGTLLSELASGRVDLTLREVLNLVEAGRERPRGPKRQSSRRKERGKRVSHGRTSRNGRATRHRR